MLVCPSGVGVSGSAPRFLSARLRQHRRAIGSRWRRPNPGRQALLALAHLRMGHTYAQLAAGFGVATTTAYRYAAEAAELLAGLAPTLADAIRAASTKAFVILDGTLPPIDRAAADRPFCSGKHKKHGMNLQVLTDPFGRLLWASPALPGAVHDVRAAREHGIIDALAAADVKCWADKAYRGSGGTVRTPCWGRWDTLSAGQKAVNRSHAKIRALVEQAMTPSKPGGSSAGSGARPPASPASSRPSSPCTWPAHSEEGKDSLPGDAWTRLWTFRSPGRPASTKPSPVSVRATTSSLTAPSSPPTGSARTSRTAR